MYDPGTGSAIIAMVVGVHGIGVSYVCSNINLADQLRVLKNT